MFNNKFEVRFHKGAHGHSHERVYKPGHQAGSAASGHGHEHGYDDEHEHEHEHEHENEHKHEHGFDDEHELDHDHGHGHEHDHEQKHGVEKEKVKRNIVIKEEIHGVNDRIAAGLNEELSGRKIFMVNVMGAPGAGKTSSLISIIKNLKNLTPHVVEGDIESDLDAVTMQKLGVDTIQINTGGACHLDSPLVKRAIEGLEFEENSIVFIENIGNLVCPAEFSIGEHVKMLIATVTEGSDKPYKYPLAFEKADIIILNKVDLIPYVDFDEKFFTDGVRALNKKAPLIHCSSKTGEGFDKVATYLEAKAIVDLI